MIQPAIALEALALMLEAAGGTHLPARIWTPLEDTADHTLFWPRNDGTHLRHLVAYHDETYSAEVLVGFPRPRRGWGTCGKLPLLWTRTESKDSAKRLRRLHPLPAYVLREGNSHRYTAFWIIHEPLTYQHLVRANKRIAHFIRAPKKYACPDEFTFPAPGAFLRHGRQRPCPVTCERLALTPLPARAIVGGMRDAPDPDAWRKAS